MSIITDTLNRLQSSWTRRNAFDSSTKQGTYSRPESSHHAPKKGRGRLKFWSVFFGLTVTFTAMGLGMFWFGMNVAPEGSSRSNHSSSLKSQPILEETPVPATTVGNQSETQPITPPGPNQLQKPSTDAPPVPGTSNQLARNKEIVAQPSLQTEQPSSENETKDILRSTRAIAPASSQPSKTKKSTPSSQAPNIAEPKNPETANVSLKKMQDSPNHSQSLNLRAAQSDKSDSIPPSVKDTPKQEPPISANEVRNDQASATAMAVAKKYSPSNSDAERLSQGRSLVKRRLYSEAVATLSPLFATLPNQWEPWFWMGTAHMGLGQYDEAKEAFREGLARNETISQLWVQLAIVEHQHGQYSQALDALRQAELLTPNLPGVQLNLGFTLEGQGNAKSALQHYRQYLTLTDRNPVHLSTRKKVLDRILRLERS